MIKTVTTGKPNDVKLSARIKRSIVHLLMVAAVFAQWVIPASAYAAMPAAPAVAAPHAMSGMACHDAASGKSACIVHCSQADEVRLDLAQMAAMPALTAVWHAVVPPAAPLMRGVRIAAEPRLAAGPPLSILYCSLLN